MADVDVAADAASICPVSEEVGIRNLRAHQELSAGHGSVLGDQV